MSEPLEHSPHKWTIVYSFRHGLCGVLLPLFSCYSAPGFTDIYRWVDAAGNVHYGDRPRQQGDEKIEVNTRISDARRQDAERINQQYQSLYQEFKQQDAARLARELETATEKKKQEADCEQSQRYANLVSQDYAFYKLNDDGSKAYLTDEEIAAHRAKVSAAHSQYCGS